MWWVRVRKGEGGEGGDRLGRRKRRDGGGEWFIIPTLVLSPFPQPENLLLYRKGSLEIKIVDFGLAVQLQEGQEMKSLVGTAEYVCKSCFLVNLFASWTFCMIQCTSCASNVGRTYTVVFQIHFHSCNNVSSCTCMCTSLWYKCFHMLFMCLCKQ